MASASAAAEDNTANDDDADDVDRRRPSDNKGMRGSRRGGDFSGARRGVVVPERNGLRHIYTTQIHETCARAIPVEQRKRGTERSGGRAACGDDAEETDGDGVCAAKRVQQRRDAQRRDKQQQQQHTHIERQKNRHQHAVLDPITRTRTH